MTEDDKSKERLAENLETSQLIIAELKEEISRLRNDIEDLLRSEERYRFHFSLANDVMFSYDNQFKVLSVSPNVERILGYKPEEFVGKTFHEAGVLNPGYMNLAINNALKVLSGETVHSSIYEFITKDGTRKYGEVSGVPLIRDGKVEAVITVARDVTPRISMENSLRESEERYRITLETMPDAVGIMGLEDCRYLYVNAGFCKMTGYSFEEAVGKAPAELNLEVSPNGFEDCAAPIREGVNVDSKERRFRRKDGTILDALVSARPIHFAGTECMIMVMTDVTAVKKAKEERMLLEIRSEKIESITTLARGIAHDFNNILTTIIGYTRMSMKDIASLSKGDASLATIRNDLSEVQKSALRARDLVDQILAFSRHSEKAHVPVELGSAVRESIRILRAVMPKTIEIRENVSSSGTILGDPAHLHQIMMNLFTNAAHAMNESGGEVEVSIERVRIEGPREGIDPDLPAGPYVKLSVRDTGRGMSPRVLSRIFDPYFTTKGKGYGTGLGLSVVHGIVKSHRGTICCRSAPGQGTTIEIYFPEIGNTSEETAVPVVTTRMPKPGKMVFVEEAPVGSGPESRAAGSKKPSGKAMK
ncbi:MAG TPA: PAS domain S-box protein [Deltaproteobacteria bacterium]|jgi:PAS domain S-box-containing protein|nr:PAS domain S-box protein [Deltaproteobacteria bacterium]HQI00359.1 PAS domain S-box protein [Deltaproteobacteria bacterium]